jgi:hypothetical protein
MGTLDCGAMVIRGYFDCFDRCIGAIEHIESLLAPVQLHVPTPMNPDMPVHTYDEHEQERIELCRAKQMIEDACQIAQEVMARI